MTMPRLSGADALHQLRLVRSDVPVLISSGYSEQEIRERFAGEEVAGFIQKPYQGATLAARLRAAIGETDQAPGGTDV
jgi:DNA-binding response OmpR family regulator